MSGNASFLLEAVFTAILGISGLVNIWAALKLAGGKAGRQLWMWIMLGKVTCVIFITRILDMILLSYFRKEGQEALDHN